MEALDNERIIKTGDWLSIQFLADRKPSQIYRVSDTGEVPVPYLSPLKAVGLTCKVFAFHIKRELEKNYFSMFTVIVKFTYKPKIGSMEALDNQRRLKSENIVSIRILGDKREALQQVVAVTGEIQVPYLGLLKAEGLTCRELALQIKAGLEKEFFKVATVLVTKDEEITPRLVKCFLQPPTVVLFGKAKRTAIYDLPTDKDQTVSGLLERAGGHTSEEAAPKIRIVRKTPLGNKIILVNSKAVLMQKRPEFDLFLREDDVMFVE